MSDAPSERRDNGRSQARITEITVGGFKSIATTQSIEVRPLTVLAGANSSGKSSFIQPLLLLKQTLDAPYDPGPLLLNGPNVKFTSGEQLLARTTGHGPAGGFEVGVRVGFESGISVAFSYERERGFDITQNTFWLEGQKHVISSDMNQNEVRALSHILHSSDREVFRNRCFLALVTREKDTISGINTPGYGVAHLLSGLIHIPGLRGTLERAYPNTGTGPTYPGTFDNYVASLVDRWQSDRDEQRLAQLNTQLQRVGLTRRVRAKRLNDAQIELHVDRLPANSTSPTDFVNIADVGFGVQTALPILLALLTAKWWQAVYMEQPELHLHPKAQVKLADVLVEAVKSGVRVIAETHGSLLIRAIQTLAAKGELDPKLVKLHWFSRNEKDGATTVTSADLDENGAFGDWPMDFDDVEFRSTGDYLDAVELRGK